MSGGRSIRLKLSRGLNQGTLDELRLAAKMLMEEANVDHGQRAAVAAVVEELGTNVMEHSGAFWLELGIVAADHVTCLSLSDNGPEFDPVKIIQSRDFSADIATDEGRSLGLFMLKQLTESMRYLREEGGINRVILQLAARKRA